MFGNTWRVGSVAGVEIRVDASWTVIVFLIGYSLYLRFVDAIPRLQSGTGLVLAALATALFFGSVLTHELAHAMVSLRRGIPVSGITLFLFGGATHAKLETRRPKDEFLIAVVGPLTSLVLAGVFWAISRIGFLPGPLRFAVGYLGLVNLLLAIFNLLPGFPLDGGRLLRSIVWGVTGSLTRATRVASTAGQGFGYLLIAIGVLWLFQGNLVGGIWFAAIGWFLAQAAWGSYQQLHVRKLLERVDAEDVMSPSLVVMPAGISLQDAVDDYFMRYDHSSFPVVENESPVGLLTLSAVRQVPREEWGTRTAETAMLPLDEVTTVRSGARMDRVVEQMQDGDIHRVLVTEDGRVVGIITPRDVARWLRRSAELGIRVRAPA